MAFALASKAAIPTLAGGGVGAVIPGFVSVKASTK